MTQCGQFDAKWLKSGAIIESVQFNKADSYIGFYDWSDFYILKAVKKEAN